MAGTSAPCPHCGALHDVSARISGDRTYCRWCDGWFVVRFQSGGAQLVACDPPATWPKERRNA